MKRILLSLIAASALAFAAAAPAGAANLICGKSYAFIVQGAAANTVSATGSPDSNGNGPGVLTPATGAGVVSFNATGTNGANGCSIASGEMIYNQGDIQQNGVYAGPAHCYDSDSLLASGLPCFDGGDHFTGTGLTSPGIGTGSVAFDFNSGATWYDTAQTVVSIPFHFTLQPGTGAGIVVGSSVADPTGTNAPLTITMQKIGLLPVPTAYGTAPYAGNEAVSCSAYGADASDFVSAANAGASGSVVGGFGSVIGSVEVFSTGDAGGAITFNSNDDQTVSGATATPSNNDCSIVVEPGTADPGYSSGGVTASQFADGTSNSVAGVGNSGTDCSDAATAGAGYTNSAIAWGAKDTASYLTTTGLSSATTGFIPPGTIGTCTTYSQAPAGKLTALILPGSQTVTGPIFPQTKTSAFKMTSTTPADCGVNAAIALASGTPTLCSAALTGTSTDVHGDIILQDPATFGVSCTCTSKATLETDTYTVTLSPDSGSSTCTGPGAPLPCCTGAGTSTCKTACPISITSTTFTCKN